MSENAKAQHMKWSPSEYVQNSKTPQLIVHGEKDYRVPVTEGLGAFTALQRLGVPSKFLYFPDEGISYYIRISEMILNR